MVLVSVSMGNKCIYGVLKKCTLAKEHCSKTRKEICAYECAYKVCLTTRVYNIDVHIKVLKC